MSSNSSMRIDITVDVRLFDFSGRSIHVMSFEVGAVLEDSKWQAPVYCFQSKDGETNASLVHDAQIWEHRQSRMVM